MNLNKENLEKLTELVNYALDATNTTYTEIVYDNGMIRFAEVNNASGNVVARGGLSVNELDELLNKREAEVDGL